MTARYNIQTRAGDTFTLTVTYKFEGSVVDLTGYTFEWYVAVGDSVNTYTASPEITVPDPTSGAIILTLSALQTTAFTKSNGSTFLRVTSGGGVVTTLVEGSVKVDGI